MTVSRRTQKRVIQIIGIVCLIICVLFFGSIVAVWAFFEIDTQRRLPQIQAALDQTCGVGVVRADRDGYDLEFSDYYSAQATCHVDGRGGYTCDCYTPTPANP